MGDDGSKPRRTQRLTEAQVLRYALDGASRSTVLRFYIAWRQRQVPPLPIRCDNAACTFHTAPLVWNGAPFKPILDHIQGNNSDNRPHMLRFLCPNCDSQQTTRGGGNRGKVEKSSGGFALISGGKRSYVLPIETGTYNLELAPTTSSKKAKPRA